MQQFMREFPQLNGIKAKVLLKHELFGRQLHNCDAVRIINDDRIGIIIKNQPIFVYKQDVSYVNIDNNTYTISDGILTISIYMNKM